MEDYKDPKTEAFKKIKRIRENYENPSSLKVAGYIMGGTLLVAAGGLIAYGLAVGGGAAGTEVCVLPLVGGGYLIYKGWRKIRDPKLLEEDMKNQNEHLKGLLIEHNQEVRQKVDEKEEAVREAQEKVKAQQRKLQTYLGTVQN